MAEDSENNCKCNESLSVAYYLARMTDTPSSVIVSSTPVENASQPPSRPREEGYVDTTTVLQVCFNPFGWLRTTCNVSQGIFSCRRSGWKSIVWKRFRKTCARTQMTTWRSHTDIGVPASEARQTCKSSLTSWRKATMRCWVISTSCGLRWTNC